MRQAPTCKNVTVQGADLRSILNKAFIGKRFRLICGMHPYLGTQSAKQLVHQGQRADYAHNQFRLIGSLEGHFQEGGTCFPNGSKCSSMLGLFTRLTILVRGGTQIVLDMERC